MQRITADNSDFEFNFVLPPGAKGKSELNVTFEVDRALKLEGDERELGLIVKSVRLEEPR